MAYASMDIPYAVDTARLEIWTNEFDADSASNQSTIWAKGQIYILCSDLIPFFYILFIL